MTTTNSNSQFSNTAVCEHRQDPSSVSDREWARSLKKMKALYQADQQTKFLNLHAETASLLHQLQALKQQRQEVSK
ncbi:hypothetical protein [Phormidesmis priestleyi]|uniref:hypothetical protein n=1 Tax=Phormidesmis priestleyi TaxID=268141 RepID=UPI00083B11FF|nr:hypothetical protein [Phormidesmis priestleyi]